MEYEYEGRTEKEAIETAIQTLGLERGSFDVEIIESTSSTLFKKGKVRIKIHPLEEPHSDISNKRSVLEVTDFETKIIEFISELINKMGYQCKITILCNDNGTLRLRIDSENAAILIGKKGRTLDALQLLVNAYAVKLGNADTRVVLDSENYRARREETLIRLAYETAEQVRSSKNSILLEPLNPFDRRIVHTTLNDIVDITTKSEGQGQYKQIRVTFRGYL